MLALWWRCGLFRHLLLTLDISPLSEAVIPHAVDLARAMGLRVTLLHVVDYSGDAVPPPASAAALLAEGAQAYLDGVATQMPGLQVRTEVRHGRPAREILDAARELDIDLIAMAAQGHPGTGRPAFGRTAEQVLHESAVPVLLVRAS